MGPNSISRDRSNDSNNGHNSEDDTNLSGVEEMEESITGKIFLSNPAMIKGQVISKKFSFEPKNKRKYFCTSSLASKMGQIIKIMAHYHAAK